MIIKKTKDIIFRELKCQKRLGACKRLCRSNVENDAKENTI